MMFDFDKPQSQEELYELFAALVLILVAVIVTSFINS